jgi:hypothetical protein
MSQNFNNNNHLLSRYKNFQKDNMPFQNNALLNNNTMFQNAMNYNNSHQMRSMHMMHQQMSRLKQLEQLKQFDKASDIDKFIDKDKIKESVIKPFKIEKATKKEIDDKYFDAKGKFEPERKDYWTKRTNQPYKNILKNEDYTKAFKAKEDLIVHRVTDADKLQEKLDKEFRELERLLDNHNDQIAIIYSSSNKTKHKKKFDYTHVNKYQKITYDPTDFSDLKKGAIEKYKKEQQNLEKDKKKVDQIIENLVNTGIFNENDIKKINENNDDGYNDEFDVNKLQKEISSGLSKEQLRILENGLSKEELKMLESELSQSELKMLEKGFSKEELEMLENEPKTKKSIKTKHVRYDDEPNVKIINKRDDDIEVIKPKVKIIKKDDDDDDDIQINTHSNQPRVKLNKSKPIELSPESNHQNETNKPKIKIISKFTKHENDVKNTKNISKNEIEPSSTKLSDDIKDKYRARQKKKEIDV